MRRLLIVTGIVMGLLAAGTARADESKAKSAGEEGKMKAMMKAMMAKMSEGERLRHKVLMKAGLNARDPAALLALKDVLDLSQGQVDELEAVAGTARLLAASVLTREQAAKLKPLKGTPDSMMAMHKKMMAKMKMDKDKAKAHKVKCPVCGHMRARDGECAYCRKARQDRKGKDWGKDQKKDKGKAHKVKCPVCGHMKDCDRECAHCRKARHDQKGKDWDKDKKKDSGRKDVKERIEKIEEMLRALKRDLQRATD